MGTFKYIYMCYIDSQIKYITRICVTSEIIIQIEFLLLSQHIHSLIVNFHFSFDVQLSYSNKLRRVIYDGNNEGFCHHYTSDSLFSSKCRPAIWQQSIWEQSE